jgi:hypothetical protein
LGKKKKKKRKKKRKVLLLRKKNKKHIGKGMRLKKDKGPGRKGSLRRSILNGTQRLVHCAIICVCTDQHQVTGGKNSAGVSFALPQKLDVDSA